MLLDFVIQNASGILLLTTQATALFTAIAVIYAQRIRLRILESIMMTHSRVEHIEKSTNSMHDEIVAAVAARHHELGKHIGFIEGVKETQVNLRERKRESTGSRKRAK